MAKVILSAPITVDRYGLHFEHGEAHTNNEYLINKLIRKGVNVVIEKTEQSKTEEPKAEKTIDEMTINDLKKYAEENNIEIPSNIKSKADIVEFIKNYKEDDSKPDNPDSKPDDSSENEEKGEEEGENSNNNAEGEDSEKEKTEEPKAE